MFLGTIIWKESPRPQTRNPETPEILRNLDPGSHRNCSYPRLHRLHPKPWSPSSNPFDKLSNTPPKLETPQTPPKTIARPPAVQRVEEDLATLKEGLCTAVGDVLAVCSKGFRDFGFGVEALLAGLLLSW